MDAGLIVGLDIGKSTLVAVLGDRGTPQSFANAPAGHAQLVHWVHAQQGALVVLEATGGYHVGVWEALEGAGIAGSVGHPTQLRYWMKGQGAAAKTDQLDARLLARYGQQEQPHPTLLPRQSVRTIAAVVDRRGQLVKERTREKNRHQQADPVVAESIAAHITWLTTSIRDLERQLGRLLAPEPALAAQVALLQTTPGLGQLMATRLVIELPELGHSSAKQLAMLVGVAPRDRQSGQWRAHASIGGGRAGLRHGLYQAIITTIRCDPTFAAHYAHLRERGKSVKEARIACLRKLLGILNVMVRQQLTWPHTKVGQGVFLPKTA